MHRQPSVEETKSNTLKAHKNPATGPGKARSPFVINHLEGVPACTIGSFLKKPELKKVLSTCHSSQTLFSKTLIPLLLQACVYGDYDKVNSILKEFPELLLKKCTVMDYSDRTHKDRTVYQLALGACDHDVKDINGNIVVDGMIEMIEKHFKRLTMPENFVAQMMELIKQEETAGNLSKDQAEQERINLSENPQSYYINKVMRDQYEGQFPPGHEAKEAERVQQDKAALDKIMNVIKNIKDDADGNAYVTSTSNLEDKIHKIIRIGITDEEKLLTNEEKAAAAARRDELSRLVSTVMKAPSNEFDKEFDTLKRFLIAQDGFIKKGDVFDFELLKALYQFRNHLEPKEEQTFGKHCNHQLLADVAQSYDDNYVGFGNDWNSPKNKFCWQKVFGWVERGAPACDAQVIAQGPWSILEDGEKSRRSLKFTYGGGSYYPLSADPNSEIGYNCAAGCGAKGRRDMADASRRPARAFKTYVEQKYQRPCLRNKHTVSHKRKTIE